MLPEFYPEGSTPRRGDTRYRRWMKILGAAQEMTTSANAENNPRNGDSLQTIKMKVNRAIQEAI